MTKRFRKILGAQGTDIFRNMFILATGASVAKLLGFAAMPLLSRLYSPSEFGLLSVFSAIVAFLVPLTTLRYVIAIPLPKSDRAAANIAALCIALIASAALLTVVVLLVAGEQIFSALNVIALHRMWWLVVLAVVLFSFYEVLALWATRKKQFKPIAKAQFLQAVTGNLTKIIFGFTAYKSFGLLFGQVVQQAGGMLGIILQFRSDLKRNTSAISMVRMRAAFKRHYDFPKFRLPSQILLIVSAQAPVVFFSYHYGAAEAGQLGMALMALALPVNIIGTSMGNAYFGEISKLGRTRPREILAITRSVTVRMLLVGVLPAILLIAFSKPFFSVVFGTQWTLAGSYASILSFYILANFCSAPLMNSLTVFDRQDKFFQLNMVRVVLIGLTFSMALILDLPAVETIILYTGIVTLHYLFVVFQVFSLLSAEAKVP